MRRMRSGLTSVQCSMRWRRFGIGPLLQRPLVRLQHHVDRHVAVGVDADLPVVAVRVVDRFVELILRHRQDAVVLRADVRRAHAHRPLRRGAVGDELHAADADPLVAEAGVDVGRLEAGDTPAASGSSCRRGASARRSAGSPRRRGCAPAMVPALWTAGEAGGVEQLRHVRHALARALAALLGREGLALADAVEHARARSRRRGRSARRSP